MDTNQRRKFILVITGIVILMAGLFIFSLTSQQLKLETVSSEQSDTFKPRPTTTFTFNKNLSDKPMLTVSARPAFKFETKVVDNQLVVVPVEDLFDGISYKLVLLDISNPNEPQYFTDYTFNTPIYAERREFLSSLPKNFGEYTITRLGETSLYVTVPNASASRYKEEILKLLAEKGITEGFYSIDIDGEQDPAGPAYPEQEVPH